MVIKVASTFVKAGANEFGSPRALRSTMGSECDRSVASPIILRLRTFCGVAGGGEEGNSTICSDEDESAMACEIARNIGLTADNLKMGAGSHTPLSGRVAHLGPQG